MVPAISCKLNPLLLGMTLKSSLEHCKFVISLIKLTKLLDKECFIHRGACITALSIQSGYLVACVEWLCFVCTHGKGALWKASFNESPWLVRETMRNGESACTRGYEER